MTQRYVMEQAARLGLSVWEAEAIEVGNDGSQLSRVKCIGFKALDLPIAEAEYWQDALEEALRIIFS